VRSNLSLCITPDSLYFLEMRNLRVSEKEILMGQVEEWKILAEEAVQEQDPEKFMDIIESLTRALEDRDLRKSRPNQPNQRGAA